MSDENKANSVEPNSPPTPEVSGEGNDYVARKAFEEVSQDMHKYKKSMKDAIAKNNEFEAKLRAIEEEKMQENEQWKELYEKQKQEAEQIRQQRDQDRMIMKNSVKKSALKSELGNIKSEYLDFASLDDIEVNEDGSINTDSLHKVANDFRSQHAQLIPASSGSDITGNAPPSSSSLTPKTRSLGDMSLEEKKAALHKLRIEKMSKQS